MWITWIFQKTISNTSEEQPEDSQLLIRTDDVDENEKEEQPKETIEKKDDDDADVSQEKADAVHQKTEQPMPKSQLEKELMALRRLIFGFFLFISVILFLILVF